MQRPSSWSRVPASILSILSITSLALLTPACGGDDDGDDEQASETGGSSESDTGTTETETGEEELESFAFTHRFPTSELAPFEERENCVAWTLQNDQPLYVQAVTLSNTGYFHHSNWFVVPDTMYEGEDGFFPCSERGFTELGAATAGTVLFAQSTQSFVEEQRTGDGAVIKIPPRHKVVAGTHLLNVGPAPTTSDLFMTLDIIHPRDVQTVLTPFRLSYLDLDIPANSQSHFTGVCDTLGSKYEAATGKPIDIKLHYVLPHFHYLGNYFNLTFLGGQYDGQTVYELNGFTGEANGGTFDPPLDLSGVTGIRYTCGYDNWRDVNVGWGVGDQEMCVMLGLAEMRVLMDISVTGGTEAVGQTGDGVYEFEGPCGVLAVPKNGAQAPPSDAERSAPLYVPPVNPEDQEIPPVPPCTDHDPSVQPALEPTLSNVNAVVFQQSCAFNSCHGSAGAAGGLDLQAANLHAELLGHDVSGNAGASLVEPGDPENSWLYEIMASCTPTTEDGLVVTHMPRNAPVLLSDESIALVREWIAAGALDD